MTQHTGLIDRLRYEPTASQYLSLADLIASLHEDRKNAANALEAQAREIAELKAQEAELCTLYGLAQAECQKLRAELDRANKVAAPIHEGLKTIPQDEPTPHGAQP